VAMGLQTLRGTEQGSFPFDKAVAIWGGLARLGLPWLGLPWLGWAGGSRQSK
jgi:hypothetical protein